VNALRRFLELFLLFTVLLHGRQAGAITAIPPNAKLYLPILKSQIKDAWPTMPLTSSLGAQVEQESCVSLKSRMCWNPHAQLKTSREYGFGLGQLTIAYQANGAERFNAWKDVKRLDHKLSSWKWQDRFNPTYQLRAVVVRNHQGYISIKFPTASTYDRLAFMYAAYNGGLGGVLQDHRLCNTIKGCNSEKWFGNVADHSFKSKIKIRGYGQSFFEVNRGYVKNVLVVRRPKYVPYLDNNK
jgi:hypothetical protein